MTCSRCGAECAEGAEFCPQCLGDPRSAFAREAPLAQAMPVVDDVLDAPAKDDALLDPKSNRVLAKADGYFLRYFIVFFAGAGVAAGYVPFHRELLADRWWVSVLGLAAAVGFGGLLVNAARQSKRPDGKWGGMSALHWAIAVAFLFALGVVVGATAK